MDSEKAAILIAGLAEFKPLGRPARFVESAAVLNDDYHLALKLKLQGWQQSHSLPQAPASPRSAGHGPPRRIACRGRHESRCQGPRSTNSAGPGRRIRANRSSPWSRGGASLSPTKRSGASRAGTRSSRDYRCWVASITKTVTALLFSQFVDQRLIALGRFAVRRLPRLSEK